MLLVALIGGLLLGGVIGWARYVWARRPVVVEIEGRWVPARSADLARHHPTKRYR